VHDKGVQDNLHVQIHMHTYTHAHVLITSHSKLGSLGTGEASIKCVVPDLRSTLTLLDLSASATTQKCYGVCAELSRTRLNFP